MEPDNRINKQTSMVCEDPRIDKEKFNAWAHDMFIKYMIIYTFCFFNHMTIQAMKFFEFAIHSILANDEK